MPGQVITNFTQRQQLAQFVKSNKYVIVKFTADWCGPCKRVAPFFDKCFESMPNNCHLVIVDVDEGNDISASMKIKQVPTFMNFIDGYPQDVYSSSGEAQVHDFMMKTFNRINGTLE